MCSNQRNKRFMVRNQPVSREQYDELMKNEWSGSREQADKLYEEFESLILKSIHRENRNFKCEGCTGDHLIECNDCTECFEVLRADNCRRMYDSMGAPSADCMDCDHTPGGQLNYETSSCYPIWNSAFSLLVYDGRNAYYSINCFNNCDFIFGCVGLKKKEYCILNKKYSKQEYEKLVGDIIISMIEDDDWGKFFPPNMSPYAYNESIANDYWPKNKTESIKSGFCWLEKDYSPKFGGEFYEPLDDIAEYAGDEDKQNELLNSIIKCNISGKPFKIIPKELAFYLKNNIPIPRVSFFERHKERMKFRNPRELFERKCDLCNKNMQTSYAPDRLEKVYCVDCYQKTVL